MKNFIILFLLIIQFNISFAQKDIFEYEIFYMLTECRDSINQDFPEEKFKQAIGVFSFEQDTVANLISVRGDFTNWKKHYWPIMGDVKKISSGDFNQIIFPVMDLETNNIAIVSFIVGPFKFPKEAFEGNKEKKFEATILYKKKRHTFIGIF